MAILRAILSGLGRLLGLKPAGRPSPGEQEWPALLHRFRAAQVQIREACTPDELEVAHCAFMAARADLEWQVRLAKRERGMGLRPIAENHRLYQAMVQHLHGEPAEGGRSLG